LRKNAKTKKIKLTVFKNLNLAGFYKTQKPSPFFLVSRSLLYALCRLKLHENELMEGSHFKEFPVSRKMIK
jgi:hypothetical protein